MTMIFKTKRDINGNTYYLTISLNEKTYSRRDQWFSGTFDAIIITRKEMRKIIDQLINAGYTEIEE